MKTLIKWPGGKEKELPVIRKYCPDFTGKYIEPFLGGGAVFFDMTNHFCYGNDKSLELMNFYQCVKLQNRYFVEYLQTIAEEFLALGHFVDVHKVECLGLYSRSSCVGPFIAKHLGYFQSIAKE